MNTYEKAIVIRIFNENYHIKYTFNNSSLIHIKKVRQRQHNITEL